MTWIKTKPARLEAWHLTDSDFADKEHLERVTEWVIARGGVAYQRDGQLYVLNFERLGMTPHAGDWIIKRDGEFIVCPYLQFSCEYEKIDASLKPHVYGIDNLRMQFTVGEHLLSVDLAFSSSSPSGFTVVVGSMRDSYGREPDYIDYDAAQAALTEFLSPVP